MIKIIIYLADLASDEIPFIKEDFKKRIMSYSNEFAESIASVSRDFRNCDPVGRHKHIRGDNIIFYYQIIVVIVVFNFCMYLDVTFTEMWGLTQSIVMSEFSLASRRSCAGTCSNVHNKPNNHQFCYNKPMHDNRPSKTDTRAYWWYYDVPEKPELCPTPKRCYGVMSECIEIVNVRPCMLVNFLKIFHYLTSINYHLLIC